ncbi:hypothetical protein EVAR_81350_1 [Eumeta japonica]|uniref:Uncharacterized protein n=1 Tax=Eumeta variegata TaxID=151549 RepID=A0A4C1XDE7_EUMVA|nr:hypothetical protein EVAR_81350_1 [Eumeta japonica]
MIQKSKRQSTVRLLQSKPILKKVKLVRSEVNVRFSGKRIKERALVARWRTVDFAPSEPENGFMRRPPVAQFYGDIRRNAKSPRRLMQFTHYTLSAFAPSVACRDKILVRYYTLIEYIGEVAASVVAFRPESESSDDPLSVHHLIPPASATTLSTKYPIPSQDAANELVTSLRLGVSLVAVITNW